MNAKPIDANPVIIVKAIILDRLFQSHFLKRNQLSIMEANSMFLRQRNYFC